MPCNHEFGIIDCLEDYYENEYNPKKYNCTYLDDDFYMRYPIMNLKIK